MKKIFTLTLVFLAMMFGTNAQYLLQESFNTGVLPTGWTTQDSDGDGYTWDATFLFQNDGPHSGDGMIASASYINGVGALTPDNWLISPAVNITTAASLTFWVKGQDASDYAENYSVYVATSNTTAAFTATTPVLTGTTTNAWEQKTVDLSSYTGQTVYIAFRHHNISNMYWLDLDDVEIFAQPTDPTIVANPSTIDFGNVTLNNSGVSQVNVTAYNLTAGVTATTTAPFAVSADGTTYGTTATIAAAGGTLYVQYTPTAVGADNGTVTLASTGATNVTITLTGAGIDCSNITVPFTEGFESSIDCWTMVSIDPANDDRFGVYADAAAYEGSNDFRFSSYHTASDYNQYLISPELTLSANESYMVTFYYEGYSSSDNFKVMYSTTNNNPSSFTMLADYTNVATSWTQAAVLLPAGTKYVAINYYGNYAFYLFVDEFSISALSAPSVTISGPAQVQVGTSGTFTASSPLADTFAWYVDGVSVAGTTDTLTHTFNTAGNHNVKVVASNSVGSAADSMDVNIYTCDPITTFPFTETFTEASASAGCWQIVNNNNDDKTFVMNTSAGQVVYSYSSTNAADDYLISPELTLGSNLYGHVDYACASSSYPEKFSVYVIPENGTLATAVQIVPTVDVTNTSFETQNFDLSAYANQTVRVAIKAESDADMYLLGFTNFVVEAMPSASINVNPTSMSFSTTTGSFSPAQTASVTAYSLTNDITVSTSAPFEVSTNGTSFGTTATIPASNIVNTTLYVRFAPSASGTQTSTVTLTSGSFNATINVSGTAVDCSQPQVLPFTEDFEVGMPACWTILDQDGDGYAWEHSYEPVSYYSPSVDLSGSGNNGSEGFVLSGSYSNVNGALTPDNWLITPALAIPSNGATLTWFVSAVDINYAAEEYDVMLSTSLTPGSFTSVFNETLQSDQWEQRSVNIGGNWAGQTVYVAFRNHNTSDIFLMKVDDISVTAGVGVDNHEVNATIYPNPANNVLNINANSNINRVEVYNMMGQMVGSYTANDMNTQINTTSFANGVYTVKISTENGTTTTKFTVAR